MYVTMICIQMCHKLGIFRLSTSNRVIGDISLLLLTMYTLKLSLYWLILVGGGCQFITVEVKFKLVPGTKRWWCQLFFKKAKIGLVQLWVSTLDVYPPCQSLYYYQLLHHSLCCLFLFCLGSCLQQKFLRWLLTYNAISFQIVGTRGYRTWLCMEHIITFG